MTDANECDTNIQELNNVVISDTDEGCSFHQEANIDDIPPSLLSYFETSKSRAVVCEKLILEDLEDSVDMMNFPAELDKDMERLNEKVIWDAENEEKSTSTDPRLLSAPTETEALFTHDVSVCPNNKDEAGTDGYVESEKLLAFEVRTLEISLNEEEEKTREEFEAERERQHREEMKKEARKRQIERDFQEELKKIMEAEKLHQKEFELMEKRAQEKLDQELLLQQELISNLKKRVEEERRTREEEQRRMKDEEDKRKREEERKKVEAERKIMEEEARRKKEEERKIQEERVKKEEERKKEEQEKRRREREEKRKREEERNKKKKLEDEMRVRREEEERKNKEEVERIKKEEEERRIEEARKKMEKERRKMEEEMSMKKKKEEEMRKKKDEADQRNKMFEEKMKKSYKREHGDVEEEIKLEERKKKGEKDMKKREEEARKREKETEKIEDKKEVKEVVRKRENSKIIEELRPTEEDEKRKQEDEWRRRRQKEEMRRQRDEEDHKKSEEQIRLKEDTEGYKGYDNRKMETKDEEKKKQEVEVEERKQGKEEMRKREVERKNVEAEKEQNEEEVGENMTEVNKNTEEEIRLKEEEECKKKGVQDEEKEVRGVRANELQEKRENSMMGQNEKIKRAKTSQLEDGSTWTSSSPAPLHSESTISPTAPQHRDPDNNFSRTSIDRTSGCENQAARPPTASAFVPVCLPEHTEQKRLSWMKDCVSWSKMSLQNRRKQKGSARSLRGRGRVSEAGGLPPLSPDSLLQSTGSKSLQEVTTVTLEDLPSCSLSTLAQCAQLQSLTLRRCGLKSLEGISQLPRLCYIDVQENDISFVDCENMTSLRVLQLAHNKLTSIHGLTGAENLDVLDLSHNSITRIAGLESMRRLQRLSVDHNQLISTKGLRDMYTLLHLSCSHNHLASVEGLENSALLNTLDLRANSLTEPPSLKNQVLLRELHLDDNSISSLQELTASWLPLMRHLSVAQNRITELPPMSDCVSLANLDLRFNCVSELQNLCESLEGCQFLQEVHLTRNPLQQESGWRSTLQKAVPSLRAIDDQETDFFLSPPAVASGSFLSFCQSQLQQTHDLLQQHSRELSNASSSLDAVKTSCRHFAEALQLAEDQRFAHEYGDTTVADKHRVAGQTTPEETIDMDSSNAEKRTECQEMESTGQVPPVIPNGDNIRCSRWTFEEKLAAESRRDTLDAAETAPKTEPTLNRTNSGSVSSNFHMACVSNHQNPDFQNTAAVVIQQLWRKYRQKCGNISSPSTAEKGGGRRGGDGGKPESGPSYVNGSQDYAATVIQAFWRGFTLRRRLASALAAVTCLDAGEDDTFEEVDMDEFVFDEAALEKYWTLSLEDIPPRRYPVSEQPLSLKPPGPFPESSKYILPPPLVPRSKQAWVAGEQVDSAGQRVSPVSSNRSKSPASTSAVSGPSEGSENILEEWGFTHSHTALLLLKRAQNMKSKKQQQKKRRDASVHLGVFRNCSYQLGPVEARSRQAQNNRNDKKVRETEPGLQQTEKTERAKLNNAQAAHSSRDSESVHFLPEISADILNGGRVQLVADPGYTERLHHASGSWANSSSAAQPCKEDNYPCRNSLGHARREAPSPKRVTSAPSKKERISFRDTPVQLSGGWGGGKKRNKVYK